MSNIIDNLIPLAGEVLDQIVVVGDDEKIILVFQSGRTVTIRAYIFNVCDTYLDVEVGP